MKYREVNGMRLKVVGNLWTDGCVLGPCPNCGDEVEWVEHTENEPEHMCEKWECMSGEENY